METNNLLYFPYINVPNSQWTTRSILYWDNVGAIVPQIYREKPNKLEKDMRFFVEEQLITQIFPEDYLYRAHAFVDSFLHMISQPKFDITKSQSDFRSGKVSRIHSGKGGHGLFDELIRMQVARRKDWQWLDVENRVAKLYMMYLASFISRQGGFTPGTDDPANIDFSLQQNGLSKHAQRIRGRLLKDLMPFPVNPDISKLRMFKTKYEKQLRNFRNYLEQMVIELASIPDTQQRQILYQLRLEAIMEEKDEIAAKLGELKVGRIIFGSLFGLTSAVSAFVGDNNPLGLFGLGNAIYSAIEGYGKGEALNGKLSYLALIEKKLTR